MRKFIARKLSKIQNIICSMWLNTVKKLAVLVFVLFLTNLDAQNQLVKIDYASDGIRLMVDGKPLMINGMNWDYIPIGTNYTYSLWSEPDHFIRTALDNEMSLLQNMGVNAIRVYTGIPARWITYIYDNYGIFTMLNHSFGRYGVNVRGTRMANTEYSDSDVIDLLLRETKQLAFEYKNTRGLLLYLLGNENNYGLFWGGAETEDVPVEDRNSTQRAKYMYKLFNDAAKAMKAIDPGHPVAICNGDLLFIDLIVSECKDVDIFGTNMYRGVSFGDAFQRVAKEYGKPVLFTEFGSDAFHAINMEEDQQAQAFFLRGNWEEIYANAAGLGLAGNSLGGFTFQFSDGWWKYGQTSNLDVHDTNASWENGGYFFDYKPGQNNMNEEWFGICAKGPTSTKGFYDLYPRAAYYTLKKAHEFDPYREGSSINRLKSHFSGIQIGDAVLTARGDAASLQSKRNSILSVSRFGANLSTFNTGGSLISTPQAPVPGNQSFPDQLGFDHMQSFFVGIEANPTANFKANVEFNILGNVAGNPIDQIFYENRGRPVVFNTQNGLRTVESVNRLQVYQASYQWNHRYFNLNGFYRTGHYHWGYEGDFFGLYPEANYGPVIDIYNGIAPFGMEFEGKQELAGLKVAFGPQLWWGANPAVLVKYSKTLAGLKVTGIFHEDLDQLELTESSFAIPMPKTRRLTLHVQRKFGLFGFDVGGIWGGQPLNGRIIQVVRGEPGALEVFQTKISDRDNWGGKWKLFYEGGRFNWYGQGAVMGLVAQGGADYTQTFTGWRLKDSGSGNQYNVLSGFTYLLGNIQIAPNFLWQRPIEGPIPRDTPSPARPRNILEDPFVVRLNRETIAGEFLLTYDPTPGTWMYDWDNDRSEDAKLAISAGVVFRHHPTTMDAAIGILPDGRTTFAFPGAVPAADLWEFHGRFVSKWSREFGFIFNAYGGQVQANGSDTRLVTRYGVDAKSIYKQLKLSTFIRFNDWGPYDYHRDFNLTFPFQSMVDLSYALGRQDWLDRPNTRIGFMLTYRTLDRYSPRYQPTRFFDANGNLGPDPNAIGFDRGNEWEIRTYVIINISK
jgi:hypothetical protein